jgi:hypothetical protein
MRFKIKNRIVFTFNFKLLTFNPLSPHTRNSLFTPEQRLS